MTVFEKEADLSMWEAGGVIVGEVFTGRFIMTELPALGNIAHTSNKLNQIFLIRNACNIVL